MSQQLATLMQQLQHAIQANDARAIGALCDQIKTAAEHPAEGTAQHQQQAQQPPKK